MQEPTEMGTCSGEMVNKRETVQNLPPAPPGSFLKELRNFFCCFQGFVAFWGGHCCGAAYVYFECFSGFRADVSCCPTKIYLTSAIQTGRCGRICLFNLTVAEFECKYRYCECILVVVRHILYSGRFSGYRADVSCIANNICLNSTCLLYTSPSPRDS